MSNNMFNIRRISTEKVPPSLLSEGVVHILGRKEALNPYAHQVYYEVLRGIDYGSTFYHYDIVVEEGCDDLADYFECNIMCLLPNRINGTAEVVVASAVPDELGLAVVAVINEVESRTLDMTEATIALCALGAPDYYRQATATVVEQELLKGARSAIAFRGKSQLSKDTVRGIAPLQSPAIQKVSEKDIRAAYETVAGRHSDRYEHRKLEATVVLYQSLGRSGKNSLSALILSDQSILRKVLKAKETIASKYSLRIQKWSGKEMFVDNYNYCLYLVDNKGEERLLKFHSTPAYCLYIMYVMDRYTRGYDATDLSFIENKAQFIELYKSLFNEKTEKIESYCNAMIRRKTPEGKWRAGRYDEYIKDIHDTLEQMVGSLDSMVLKVGHGNFLAIPKDNIEIDQNLPILNFI